MNMTLHINRLIAFRRTWLGMNQWIRSVFAEFRGLQDSSILYYAHGHPRWIQWPNDHEVAHLQAKTVPMNWIWRELAQWLMSYGIRRYWPGRTDGQTNGQTHERTHGDNSLVLLFPSDRAGTIKWHRHSALRTIWYIFEIMIRVFLTSVTKNQFQRKSLLHSHYLITMYGFPWVKLTKTDRNCRH